jgi:hypothetical protein
MFRKHDPNYMITENKYNFSLNKYMNGKKKGGGGCKLEF